MAKVSLKNVSKTFPGSTGKDAIRDLSLEIHDREFVVLVGPPKCGITSILRMIAGLDQVSGGDIFIDDRRVNEIPPRDRDVALVPAGYIPYPRLSLQDNLALALTLRKRPKAEIERRVRAAAELTGLQDILSHGPGSLSVEQCQRLAIARAIAFHPKVFLFDDALSGLTAKARPQLRHEITKLHQRLQVTMIYGTRDPIEALGMGGQVVVLKDGIVEQTGTASSLYAEPVNAFVAEFLSSMNLVEGTLKQERGGWVFVERNEGTLRVQLPDARGVTEGPILLGIRPEDIEERQVTTITEKDVDSFAAIIDYVEPMGAEANIYLQTGAHTVMCRVRQAVDSLEAGHRSQFRLNPQGVCLFDPATRERIS